MGKALICLLLALVLLSSFASALDFTEPSSADKATFDKILEPVMKVYNFIKYAASVIGVIMLVVAGISFMTAGTNQMQRDNAKSTATYVVIGLIIVWVAPMIVNYLIQ
jgi:type IV secretory pathway VirB2 component (pilin)